MKNLYSWPGIILITISLQAYANPEIHDITHNIKRLSGCPLASDLETSITPNKKLMLSINNKPILEITEENYKNEIIIGKTPNAKQCFIAVKNAESQVNESYSLFILDPEAKTIKPSRIATITNPDFKESNILNSFRDASRWNYESLCYAGESKDYYQCEHREEIYKGLTKYQECSEKSCEPARISQEGKTSVVGKIVAKAYLYKESEEKLIRSKSYLITGDNVSLLDFKEKDQMAFFKVQFNGKTTGWVEEHFLVIE